MSGIVINKPESRHYSCEQYDKCLMKAAKKNKLRLGCRNCNRYRQAEFQPVQNDMEGILLLMVKLYGGAPQETSRFFWNSNDGHAVSGGPRLMQEAG